MSRNKHINEDAGFGNIINALRKEPVLNESQQLTDNILEEINSPVIENRQFHRTLTIMTRVLAAASVALLIVFGVEQYIFIDKVIQLEDDASSRIQNSTPLKGINLLLKNVDIEKMILVNDINETITTESNYFKSKLLIARVNALNLNDASTQQLSQIKSLMQQNSADIINSGLEYIKERKYE